MKDRIKNFAEPVCLGNWRFHGYIGDRIDTMTKARFTSKQAWDTIYPETEEAFRLREDDTSHPGRGVWRGEFWGKYILCAIAACRYDSSEELKERIATAVKGLLSTQDEDGYIGTYTDSKYFGADTWNIWCRKYTLWALLEAWDLLQDDSILEAASQFADHLIGQVGPDSWDIIQTGQFYGLPSTSILKPIVMLYRATNNQNYLQFANYIVDQWTNHPSGIPDILNKGLTGEPIHLWFPKAYEWAKSYEFVSCVEGLLELFRVTGKKDYLTAGKNIHAAIVEWERSPVGSISFNDKFIGSRYLLNTVAELCDAVYWNRLSHQLFELTGEVRYIDEIERTLYNALLCGMKQDGSWALRRLRLSHEHIPAHNHFLQHHQCCVDNLPRGLYQAAQSAIFSDNNGIYVTLYSEAKGRVSLPSGRETELELNGDFLNDGKVELKITLDCKERFVLNLRMPFWSNKTVIAINGKQIEKEMPNHWASFERTWESGDIVSLVFDLHTRSEFFNTERFSADDPIVSWHVKEWASMGFISEDNLKMSLHQSSRLKEKDALPHQKAVMFFRGPIALARDIRLGDPDIFKGLPAGISFDKTSVLKQITPPKGVWKAYEMDFGFGETIKLCDFSSAGNTWNDESLFSAWNIYL
jgi:Uncharacterized protein conserved in bacteria